ncbi:HAD-superfamily hydrolase, subfamily IA, variant 3 [Arcobacter nitrofigilis DSM 7299]|uniref:phosphoglycolate phosphatase n=1 Tax=Arcobacter nitrofigilis (strain ATCC 33309 / DSM 7299 / CCUG 15893 / LMG 7604 / NCTC 12251 / CI) TaxID=572480 RepID=D5V557_ARCNC|nr:HAD-IA family hydrolase [Arcobacter nitrofigilis]ADG92992.1 HAD-superfamily hydrolase, subfamily IA, variant 3 [Arcobacter nitrofigilis DSM 7299]
MKKYILFDNDGVLVETEPLYFEASKRALKEFFNVNIQFDDYMKIMTEGNGVWVAAPSATKEEIIIARNKRDIYYQQYLKKEDIAIENVHDVLNELSKKYKMGIVTTSRRVDFEIIHENRGITDFMDFVLCVEDYARSKPHPDPYLKGLEKFNATNEEAIVIEDSQRGLIAAHSANIDCAIVYNEFTKTQDFSKAKYKISKLEDILKILD